VTIWLTRVGPYHNPQETYSYYALPFCAPFLVLEPQHRFSGIGEVFEGTEWVNSDLPVRFGVDQPPRPICSMSLDAGAARFLDYAVANHYVYQMSVDELPVWGMVGEVVTGEEALQHLQQHGETVEEQRSRLGWSDSVQVVSEEEAEAMADRAFLFTHRRISIGINGNRIVEVNLTADKPVHVEPGATFDLSYSVEWVQSGRPFAQRFARYLEAHVFEHHVHWFALLQSFLTVFCAVGLVAMVLGRTVSAQIAAVLRDDSLAPDASADHGAAPADEASWKLLHADVFRRPANVELLAALLGTGVQLACMGLVVVAVSVVRSLYSDRGYAVSVVLTAYAVTSFAAGHVSGAWYKARFLPKASPRWQFVMFLTASVLPSTAITFVAPANVVAWRSSTINAVSFGDALTLAIVWLVVSLPLVVVGTITGRRSVAAVAATGAAAPSRRASAGLHYVAPVPRPTPEVVPWYAHPATLVTLAGLAPFASVFIEAYFVLSSFWGYRFYFVYGFLLLVLVMLAIVTACTAVVVTYVALSHENHRWQWLSFLSSSSVAAYLFLYSLYYLLAKTQMHGLVQIAFFFAYSSLISICVAIACGAVGYLAAQWFVETVYKNLKAE